MICQLPGSAQGHPLAARRDPQPPRAPPGVPGWPPLALREWPAELRSGAEEGGWAKDEEGREAGPYLIAEDAVLLVTPGRHGEDELVLARGLQAERQQHTHSGKV